MDQILEGIEGTSCILDDMIITGKNDEEHLDHLEEGLKRLKEHALREMSCVVVLKSYDTDPYFSKIWTYHEVPRSRHATCTLGGQIRISSDSDFFRGMENQISGH